MGAKGMTIAEQGHVVVATPAIDIGGAAQTSQYVSLKEWAHATVIVTFGVVTNTATITIEESDDASGSNTTAIAFASYSEGTADGDTLASRVATGVGGIASGTTNNQFFLAEIDASQLTDGFPYIVVKATNAANALYCVIVVLTGGRDMRDGTPTVIT